jgi:hypothetical protein
MPCPKEAIQMNTEYRQQFSKEAIQMNTEYRQQFSVGDRVRSATTGSVYVVLIALPDSCNQIIGQRGNGGEYYRLRQSDVSLVATSDADDDRIRKLEDRVTDLENFKSRVIDLLQTGARNV